RHRSPSYGVISVRSSVTGYELGGRLAGDPVAFPIEHPKCAAFRSCITAVISCRNHREEIRICKGNTGIKDGFRIIAAKSLVILGHARFVTKPVPLITACSLDVPEVPAGNDSV